MPTEIKIDRDFVAEAFAIIDGTPQPGRLLLPMAEREHLVALREHYEQQLVITMSLNGEE